MADSVSSSDVVAAERAALCDLFLELGPDAPTLAGEWTTADLAAHLWARERRPDSGPGIVLGGPFADHTERVRQGVLARPYADVVGELRLGPPWYAFAKWLPSGDVHEWFVHHEDVRRPDGREPRQMGAADEVLWSTLGRLGRLLVRRVDAGVVVRTGDGKEKRLRDGDQVVTVTGDPGELLLRLFGRDVAVVEIAGDPTAVAAFEAASFGI